MVEYSNPQPPEGINASQEHPLKELAYLLAGITGVLLLVAVAVSYSATWLAAQIPFHYERSLGDQLFNLDQGYRQAPALQALAERVGQALDLSPEISIQVHYSADDTVNAFASLGGHVVIYQGLLDKLASENALAMVLAHEIAHVQHRDVARSLGRGVALSLLTSVVFGTSDSVAGQLAASGVHTGLLSFSRGQENAADAAALAAVYRLYGHTAGALQLYDILQREQDKHSGLLPVEFLSTHPLTTHRIADLRALGASQGWPEQGTVTPLPAGLAAPQP